MNMFYRWVSFAIVGLISLISTCFGESLSDSDVLQQLLQKTDEKQLIPEPLSKAEDAKIDELTTALAQLLKERMSASNADERNLQKRVFCNGFFGCSNGRKRSHSTDIRGKENGVKRAFMNFNGHGKRAFGSYNGYGFRKRAFANYEGVPALTNFAGPMAMKRVFGNFRGYTGKRNAIYGDGLEN